MMENIIIEPMTKEFILWRCLHNGLLSDLNIDHLPSGNSLAWELFRARNIPLLRKLTQTYGACAILAREGEQIVGHLRFYPKVVWDMQNAGGLCLQQDYPSGPADGFSDSDFPAIDKIEDRTLKVHCLMIGSPQQQVNPFQRKGIGTHMVKTLIQWATANGWEHIEADAFEDLPIIYEITGSAGHTFWEKLGFSMVDRHPHPDLKGQEQFVLTLKEQARSMRIHPSRAIDRLVMRLDLK
jgi:hypothetical protein